ncbi:mucus-binding protein [Lactiplantibacillus fabifermentans T30PCM01]|uniref:Mucus-binding protein n=1 Tax=Lactiplantibacillus fabifermentans T30PCM01 TaxID=1400520 RepID=W6T749_9LACO|nr:KxYKxGKxW signal peptide domain-containing protein [Lactiplantibacillus fabifermentans]ETY73974.1 mucus-binding protein [Lactiplantibacillus fabifermentans T30PCM01]
MSRDYRKYGIEGKTHYKLYKSGRNWVTAGITLFSLGLGLTFTQLDQVKAATASGATDADSSSSVSSAASVTSGQTVVLKNSSTSTSTSQSSSSTSAVASDAGTATATTKATQTSSAASGDTTTAASATSSTGTKVAVATTSTTSTASVAPTSATSSSSQASTEVTASTTSSSSTTKPEATVTSSGSTTSTVATPVVSAATTDNQATNNQITDDRQANPATVTVDASMTTDSVDATTTSLQTTTTPLALTTAQTAMAAVVATKQKRASLLRATATNTVEFVTTGTISFPYDELIKATSQLANVISGPTYTVASGDPDIAMYAKNANGDYLYDVNDNKVNLLYALFSYGDPNDDFVGTYTDEAGTTVDISNVDLSATLNAGTYNLSLSDDGKAELEKGSALQDSSFAATTDQYSYLPTDASFSGTYSFEFVVTPVAIQLGKSVNSDTIVVGGGEQQYNKQAVSFLPGINMFTYQKEKVFMESATGKVLVAVNLNVKAGDMGLTADDFDIFDAAGNLTTIQDAGTYTVKLNADGVTALQNMIGQNYTLVGYDADNNLAITTSYTVDKAPLSVQANATTVVYDGTAHGTTVSVKNGTNYDDLTFTAVAQADQTTQAYTNAGTYEMTATVLDADEAAILAKNYTVTSTDGTLVIEQAPLTVTTADATVTYDGQAHETTATVTSGTNYDNLTFKAVAKADDATTTYTDAGSYTMTGTTTAATSNYQITYVDGTLTIEPAAATITIPSQTYWVDGTTKNLTATVTGTVNGETLNCTLTDGLATVGSQTVTATYDKTDAVDKNYVITVVPGTLTIGDVTVEYDYDYLDASGQLVTVATATGTASHDTDATASDYLSYTTTPLPKTGYTLASDNTGLAANGTLSGTGGVVKYVYLANTEKATVTYFDETTQQTLKTIALSGQYGTTDAYNAATTITDYEKAGYQLVSSTIPSTGISYTTDGTSQSYQVNLTHQTMTVDVDHPGTPGEPIDATNPNGPKYPDGTAVSALKSTRTRTIDYVYATTGQSVSAAVTQNVIFTRTATIDEVSGTVTYGAWTTDTGTFAAVTSPSVTGYTADKTSVAAATVAEDTPDSTVTVTYTPNLETATITFVDATTGETLGTPTTISGAYASTSTYSPQTTLATYLAAGYQLDHSDVPTTGIVFDEDGSVKAYTVTLSHHLTTVDSDHPGTPGQPIDPDNPTGPKYPAGTAAESLTTAVTRTINYQYADTTKGAAAATALQTVTFDRTATIDDVTGVVTYTAWQTTAGDAQGNFATVVSPTITGYTADQAQVASAPVTVTSPAVTVTVTYAANAEAATVTFIDTTTDQQLAKIPLTGTYGETSPYSPQATIDKYVQAGYQLASSTVPATGIVFNQDGVETAYLIKLAHATASVSVDTPGTPGQPIDANNPTGPKYPTGTTAADLTKTITRTINYRYADATTAAPATTQTVTFTRTATIDEVTGAVTYTTWTTRDSAAKTGTYSAVLSPTLTGYTTTQKLVNADTTVLPTDDDQTINVLYTANSETATVTFVDTTTNQALGDVVTVTGDFGTASSYTAQPTIAKYVAAGYRFVTSTIPTTDIQFTTDGQPVNYVVYLGHQITAISENQPGVPNTPIDPDNPTGPKYPAGTDAQALTKQVKRVITYTNMDVPAVTQTVTFERTAVVDNVTGQVTYGAWTVAGSETPTGTYAQVTSPKVTGYTATTAVAAQSVTGNDADTQVTVAYQADAEQATVTYIDATNDQVLKTQTLTGLFAEPTAYRTGTTIAQYTAAGYVLMKDTFPTDGAVFQQAGQVAAYSVYLVHGKTAVTDAAQLTRVVTQTINYQDQQGATLQPATSRQLTFSRSGIVDKVTGIATYSAWQPVTGTTFTSIEAPNITGYTAETSATTAVTVNATSQDDAQTLVYQKVGQPVGQPTTPATKPGAGQPTTPATKPIVGQPTTPATKPSAGQTPVSHPQLATMVKTSQNDLITPTKASPRKLAAPVKTSRNDLATPTKSAPSATAKTLPQTNDNHQASLVAELVGLSLASLLAGFGLVTRKRHE